MIHGIAKKRWELMTSFTEQELITFADRALQAYTGEGLDSLDIGDAFGAMISIAESEEYAGNLEFYNTIYRWNSRYGESAFIIVYNAGFDLFEWEGIPTE